MLSSSKRLHRRTCVRAVVGLAVFAVIAGCTTYQPPLAPDQDLATIEIDPNSTTLLFTGVDGQALSSTGVLMQFGRRAPIKLTPGTHTIGIEYSRLSGAGETKGFVALEFDAVANKRYRVFERSSVTQFVAWIADDAGKTVSRVKPKQ